MNSIRDRINAHLPRRETLLGPLFLYELIRSTRRGQTFLLRGVYATGLLLALFVLYTGWFEVPLDDLFRPVKAPIRLVAAFSSGFASTFLVCQFLVVLILTPITMAGAIAEQRERRTFDYLLTTDLSNWEIVMGLVASRLASLGLLLLTGLPVLGLMLFLGGLDPEWMMLGFAATAACLASMACLSIAVAIRGNSAWKSIFNAWLAVVLYFGVTSGISTASSGLPPFDLNFGNPLLLFVQLQMSAGEGLLAAAEFFLWHVLLSCSCLAYALRHLRDAPKNTSPRTQASLGKMTLSMAAFHREPTLLGERPMLWKELNDSPLRWTWGPWQIAVLVFGQVFLVCSGISMVVSWDVSEETGNIVWRIFAIVVASLMLLLVAANAAGRFSREFERDTLEGLLTTPMPRKSIMFAKWWASIVHVRGVWLAVLGLMSLMLVTGTFPWVLPLFILWWWVYAAFVASLGLWLSLLTRSTLRATVLTPLAALAIGAAFWLLLEGGVRATRPAPAYSDTADFLEELQDGVAAPPRAFWRLSVTMGELWPRYGSPKGDELLSHLIADGLVMVLYGLLAVLFYRETYRALRAMGAGGE